jgi:dephospho-CoA kinase
MRLIGLTGGIATGKSTVAEMLAGHGAAVIDADVLAREVLLPGTPGFDDAVAAFGKAVLDHSGVIDRTALAAVVFADADRRAALERITHPRINALMQDRIVDAMQTSATMVVADIPLLFEKQREADFDGTLLVYAPVPVQLQRLRERDGIEDVDAERRLAAQMPIDDKRGRATWVINNGGSRDATAAQVDRWWQVAAGAA